MWGIGGVASKRRGVVAYTALSPRWDHLKNQSGFTLHPPFAPFCTAQDHLGNAEAAARALVSALGVAAPTDSGEVKGLTALASTVLASLGGDKVRRVVTVVYCFGCKVPVLIILNCHK